MDTEIRLKGAFCRALRLGIGASFVLLAAGGLQADVLWTNAVMGGGGFSDSGGYTIFDNFNIPLASKTWAVSGFDFTDFLVSATAADYKSTSWSIWNGDPLSGGKLVASGAATASLVSVGTCGGGNPCVEMTVNFAAGSSVYLASGNTYYLGTSNVVTNGTNGSTSRVYAFAGNTAPGGTTNPLNKWEQSNGSTSGAVGSVWSPGTVNHTFPGDLGVTQIATAFDINGTLGAPEPGTMTLLGVTLAGLCFILRRRVA